MARATARTNKFFLGVAEVQMGALEDFDELKSSSHSLGLVKNFTMNADPTYTDLTQGVKNEIVDSALTNFPVRCTMEVYEGTAKNIKYGLGLDGSDVISGVQHPLDAAADAADTTFELEGDLTSTYTAGKYVMIEEGDDFHIAKVASSAHNAGVTTVTITGYPFPFGFTTAAKVSVVNTIVVGDKTEQPYLSAKVFGSLSNGDNVGIGIPKLRIIRGFTLAFTSDQYGNMPFEFTPFAQVSTDPFYNKYASAGVAFIWQRN